MAILVYGKYLVIIIQTMGALAIGYGAFLTFWRTVLTLLGRANFTYPQIRLNLTRYLLLGLEFELGADIISTILLPSFTEIARLAAIATIRTALNYFLTKEMQRELKQMGKSELELR